MVINGVKCVQPFYGQQDGSKSLGRRAITACRIASRNDYFVEHFSGDSRLDCLLRLEEPIHVRSRHRHLVSNIIYRRLLMANPSI
jgi:hypothetical protein